MKKNKKNKTTCSHLGRYSKSDDGEGCEGNECSTQDKALPILFSIREFV
jgi:hypothetical protein